MRHSITSFRLLNKDGHGGSTGESLQGKNSAGKKLRWVLEVHVTRIAIIAGSQLSYRHFDKRSPRRRMTKYKGQAHGIVFQTATISVMALSVVAACDKIPEDRTIVRACLQVADNLARNSADDRSRRFLGKVDEYRARCRGGEKAVMKAE
jgi:hypothetical protein